MRLLRRDDPPVRVVAGTNRVLAARRVHNYGVTVDSPGGWDVDILRRPRHVGVLSHTEFGTTTVEDITHPIVHACTLALPEDRGDFGSGVTTLLGTDDVFVALVEYGAESAGYGLFADQGFPALAPPHFGPNNLQRPLPGLSAAQRFFTEGGRAFCLFVVLGSHSRRMVTVPRAVALVRRISITDKATMLAQGGLP